jgi:ATP-dependent protease ClpP protease subunit
MELNTSTTEEYKINTIDNNIYFTGKISFDSIHNLIIEIKKLENLILKAVESAVVTVECKNLVKVEKNNINLYITSYGGSVHAAFSAISTIENCKVHVHTIISGHAAEAATLISLAGHKKLMYKYSTALIHEVRCASWGKYTEQRDRYENMERILNYYVEKTKIEKDVLKNLLKQDIEWDEINCLKYGIIDEII